MCIEKHLALHAKSEAGYIKHLEESLLGDGDFERCQQCKRVEHAYRMSAADEGYVCDTCLPAWERAEQKAQEIAESDERDYQHAKRGY